MNIETKYILTKEELLNIIIAGIIHYKNIKNNTQYKMIPEIAEEIFNKKFTRGQQQ